MQACEVLAWVLRLTPNLRLSARPGSSAPPSLWRASPWPTSAAPWPGPPPASTAPSSIRRGDASEREGRAERGPRLQMFQLLTLLRRQHPLQRLLDRVEQVPPLPLVLGVEFVLAVVPPQLEAGKHA